MRDKTMHDDTMGRGLARLDDLDDFKVADGDPDVRGWNVKTADDRTVGEVDSLIVDTAAMKVRYLDVKLDRKALDLDDDRHVLVPIGGARLDDDHDDVLLGTMMPAQLLALPPYMHGAITRDDETTLRRRFDQSYRGAAGDDREFYGHEHYDQNRFFGKRRAGRENAEYLTRSEEELNIGKRQLQAGEVELRKTVETEHVKRNVPVTREEVTVERRPIMNARTADASVTIGEGEITVPVMAEELVVEKRAVPKEEVVIGKKMVTENKTVEADLRKERIAVDRDVDRSNNSNKRDARDRESGSAPAAPDATAS